MICEITGQKTSCTNHFLLPKKDERNVCEKILGCPLFQYEKYWITISETVYKQRYTPHIQRAFVRHLYDTYGEEELVKLIDVIDALKYKSLLRLFAFSLLAKNGIYKPSKDNNSKQKVTKDQFRRHSRRLSVIIALRKDNHLKWSEVSQIINRNVSCTDDFPHLHKDNVWLPIKKRIDEWRTKNV
jgi:hypothetical protein